MSRDDLFSFMRKFPSFAHSRYRQFIKTPPALSFTAIELGKGINRLKPFGRRPRILMETASIKP